MSSELPVRTGFLLGGGGFFHFQQPASSYQKIPNKIYVIPEMQRLELSSFTSLQQENSLFK